LPATLPLTPGRDLGGILRPRGACALNASTIKSPSCAASCGMLYQHLREAAPTMGELSVVEPGNRVPMLPQIGQDCWHTPLP
jgi:hypothetical protein